MHRITLIIILLLSVTAADAASYQKTDGTIVDPIQSVSGGDLPYSGNNLQPGADLVGAELSGADLERANLRNADLTGADLSNADLYFAELFYADLSNAYLYDAHLRRAFLTSADLTGADLTGANLGHADVQYADFTGADLTGSNFGNVFYYNHHTTWTDAFYYTDNEPTWSSLWDGYGNNGMDAAWRESVGILALDPTNAVPEPSTLLLALLGLALVPRRRRR